MKSTSFGPLKIIEIMIEYFHASIKRTNVYLPHAPPSPRVDIYGALLVQGDASSKLP
ncbi:MAG: hypothetical protein MRY79_01815 [Alphaproteobacteria bacterium]|nr:hypothetical protein [Alphaproteobacteria bacterium]